MKQSILFLGFILSFCCNSVAWAGDVYAEYTITTASNKVFTSKMYAKNGDLRAEATMEAGGRQITSATLILKNRPDVTIVLNSATKTYNEVKRGGGTGKEITIDVLGNEKVGQYNCVHVRMSSDGKTWEMWTSKDLPSLEITIDNDAATNQRIIEKLKSKGVGGMMVKLVFFKSGTSQALTTMQLSKFESRTLDASLFTIPSDYHKSGFDPEKMKSMSPQERKEMLLKMMQEQGKK